MSDEGELPADTLHHLLPALQEGILIQAADGRVLWANQRAGTFLNRAPEELRGQVLVLAAMRRDGTMFAPHELPAAMALSSGRAQREVELGLIGETHETRWLIASAEPIQDRAQVVTTFMEISALVRRETELERAQILHQATLDFAGHAIVVTDLAGTIKIFNPAAQGMLGYSAAEMVGLCTPAVFHDLDEVSARAAELGIEPGFEVFVAAARAGVAETREWTYIRKDGERFAASLTVTALRDAQGHVFAFMGIAQNVSVRKAMERRLLDELAQRSAMEARMRGLIDGLPDLVFCVDYAGVFRYVHTPNPALLYVPREAILGRRFQELLPPEVANQVASRVRALRTGAPVSPFVYDLPTPLGERSFEARLVRSGEEEIAIVARDITESRALERMKDEFVSTVSHELRTPLTSIRGSLSLLSAGVVDVHSSDGKDLLSTALRNAERLGRLINDILDFDRAHANLTVTLQLQRIAPIVRQAVQDTQPLASQYQVRFGLASCAEDAESRVDADRLSQVMHNLLSNAAKYGDPGKQIEVSLVETPRAWRIQVSNQGPCIPESFRPKLFQRFALVDSSDRREREGTGLGLAISRALIERMGGTIDYTSSNERTSFFVDLPRAVTATPSR